MPNPSFEDTISTPCDGYAFLALKNWFTPSNQGSPDYYHECNSPISYGVPQNSLGFQYAQTGVAYAGILTYYEPSNSIREYIEVQLTEPLIANVRYYWSFSVSKADSMDYASNNLGIYLSQNEVSSSDNLVIPQVPTGNLSSVVYDTSSWTTICGEYIANGGEEYLLIGNFFNNVQTNYVEIQQGSSFTIGAYYYIDDVYLSSESVSCSNHVGVEELNLKPKKVIKILDMMGREADEDQSQNTLLIYIYSDGSSEKVFKAN